MLSQAPQVVILKFDDVLQSSEAGGPVSPRWQRLADFIEQNRLKACFGILCCSLDGGDNKAYFNQIKDQPEMVRDYPPQEADNPAYYHWIKAHQKSGFIEFWLHGYKMRNILEKTGEFEGRTLPEQKSILDKCERLAREKLGFELKTFGPHWSVTTAETGHALEAVPEIKILFSGGCADTKKLVLDAVMDLENPVFVPDFAKFQAIYQRIGAGQPMLRLQGHPDKWDEERWKGFVNIIEFLKAQGCFFMTASEYEQHRQR